MKNVNIGIVNLIVSNSLKESYFNNNYINESKSLVNDFIGIVKNSPVLQLEFKVFDNIENKHIENELMATRYIDNNIKLFEVYTINEIENERKKLNHIIRENKIPNNEKIKLYESIDVLIRESINDYDKIDVDKMHESFTYVLNHVKKPKKLNETQSNDFTDINEEVLKIAINKFNEKYNVLSEEDKNLLNTLVQSDTTQKLELLETYKEETLKLLNEIRDDSTENNINTAINKIHEMSKSKDLMKKLDENIIKLYELKKDLL